MTRSQKSVPSSPPTQSASDELKKPQRGADQVAEKDQVIDQLVDRATLLVRKLDRTVASMEQTLEKGKR